MYIITTGNESSLTPPVPLCFAPQFEADYMWGLLHPMLLNDEAGYYLTMLSSAVHVLKNLPHYLDDRSRESTRSLSHVSLSLGSR